MMKYIVAAFIAIGAMLSVSAQAAPLSPASVQTEQAIATGVAVEKVCWGGGCGWGWRLRRRWGGGGCGWRPWLASRRPCGYYGYGCGVRWWPARPAWGWGGGYGAAGGWGGGGWGWGW